MKAEEPGVFASVRSGEGRMTVITDGRIFRNRWIGDHEHAALLAALVESTEYEGAVGFLRGSGLSLWGLLGKPSVAGAGGSRAAGAFLALEKSHPLRPHRSRRRCFHLAGLRASSGGARRFPMAARPGRRLAGAVARADRRARAAHQRAGRAAGRRLLPISSRPRRISRASGFSGRSPNPRRPTPPLSPAPPPTSRNCSKSSTDPIHS